MKVKAFFTILNGLSLEQIKQIFLEGESPTLRQKVSHVFRASFADAFNVKIWPIKNRLLTGKV